ncbi:MAG: aminotransferase class III [Coxiella sp. RIFCSPHIGHO2_12_FULL_44_14]|nr:MAG: aminotransferase class III [Coxiella sp. RIFCSPHIGHO2_12_FULL_44_14]
MTSRYSNSNRLLERALKVIPLGSQTLSKSHTQYPSKEAPLFLRRGLGGRVWDVDDNEYVDLVNGLLPIVLGYRDKDVDEAIQRQLEHGISFSLATELEMELAERLIHIIPCAEMVRYGKNGSDATSAAIRLSRAYTQKERVAVCGYHGWHDWYVGSTERRLGVPTCVSKLTHRFDYNQPESLERLLQAYPNQFAAVIMEPMNSIEPLPGFLEEIQRLTHRAGALLIWDEIVTGFRYQLGGAQALFHVTPDLATFGKALGNGMPISALVGRADVMKHMEDVFYSGTFGGEALSLAAAIAVIDKMQREPVIDTLWAQGEKLATAVVRLIQEFGLEAVFSLSGKAPWKFFNITVDNEHRKRIIRTLFIREMLANGVLMLSTHNISYAHTNADVDQVITAYRSAFTLIQSELACGDIESRFHDQVLGPVFKVR